MDPVLRAANVRRRYGDTVALDGVSLTVGAGEIFGLIGPNGAGKTTLVRALTGTTAVDGEVAVLGTDPAAVDRHRIGLLPQDFDPPGRLSARELVAYYAGLYDEARDPEECLADVGMAAAGDTYYEDLSGGQRRRTCVATALVNEPEVLFLDEPTTGIDPAGRRAVWGLLEDLAAGGTTVLLTTHYMAEAQHLADRVGLLAEGSLVACDSPAALVAEHGGESLLRVEGAFETVPEGLAYPAGVADGHLAVRGVPPAAIGDVVETLTDAGLEYDALAWTEPDLEDVYMELTGRAVTAAGEALDQREVRVS